MRREVRLQGLDVGLPAEQGVEEVVALDVNGVADVGVVGLEQTPFLAGGVRQVNSPSGVGFLEVPVEQMNCLTMTLYTPEEDAEKTVMI